MVKNPQTSARRRLAALGVREKSFEERLREQSDQEDPDRHTPADPLMVTIGPPEDPSYDGPVWRPPDED
jgi:hypothetical protein